MMNDQEIINYFKNHINTGKITHPIELKRYFKAYTQKNNLLRDYPEIKHLAIDIYSQYLYLAENITLISCKCTSTFFYDCNTVRVAEIKYLMSKSNNYTNNDLDRLIETEGKLIRLME